MAFVEPRYTESDFDTLSWHDCHIWRWAVSTGSPEAGDWTSDLVFDIDFIVDWLCPVGGQAEFLVAPASLTFHGVTGLRIELEWESHEYTVAIHEVSIESIGRERLKNQKVHLDRPYYKWVIAANWPQGQISFGAWGFTQSRLAEPVLTRDQKLTQNQRQGR